MARYTIVRTKLLGVPSGLRQRDPTFTRPQIELVDAMVREALEDLADKSPIDNWDSL